MANTFQYDPAQIQVVFGKNLITGFADATFVEVERNVDAFTTVVGADGEVTRVKSQNRSGTVKITLQQASPSNDVLSASATLDEQSSTGAQPFLLKDAQGTTIVSAKLMWVKKKANTTFAATNENREWTLETGDLSYALGGENSL